MTGDARDRVLVDNHTALRLAHPNVPDLLPVLPVEQEGLITARPGCGEAGQRECPVVRPAGRFGVTCRQTASDLMTDEERRSSYDPGDRVLVDNYTALRLARPDIPDHLPDLPVEQERVVRAAGG